MEHYEAVTMMKVAKWKKKLLKRPGLFAKSSKAVQTKINHVIPDKVHAVITQTVKGIVQATLLGLKFIPKGEPQVGLSLYERDELATELLSKYKKIAAAEGAGTGAGGILMGMMDFPALIAIKMKFLFELAHIYGFNTKDYKERLFLLTTFQLAFSSTEKKPQLFDQIETWDKIAIDLPPSDQYLNHIDWEQFQKEYRDSLDLRKLLQLLPGIGAVVGAWANYGLLDDLGEVAMNCYRMRLVRKDLIYEE